MKKYLFIVENRIEKNICVVKMLGKMFFQMCDIFVDFMASADSMLVHWIPNFIFIIYVISFFCRDILKIKNKKNYK